MPRRPSSLGFDADGWLRHQGWDVNESGCWVTRVGKDSDGYGVTKFHGKHRRVHRFAYETWVGPIPDGKQINHHCDNPPCINPEHLYAGTSKENMQDAWRRGRHTPETIGKLTWEVVREIRAEFATGNYTKAALALRYGVTDVTVGHIVRGKTWKETT